MTHYGNKLSVVIPTRNRSDDINRILESISNQDIGAENYEVIVVDDGSTKPVSESIRQNGWKFKLTILRHDTNKARAAACNTGIRASTNPVIVILDDDISFGNNFLRLHYQFHSKENNEMSAAIGALEWGLCPELTPVMYFLENSEKFFPLLPRVLHDDLPSMNTANFSIRKNILDEYGLFDEEFHEYGYEDIEFGERLRSKGLRMRYLDDATVRHHKVIDLGGAIKRQFALGKMLALFYKKNTNASQLISSYHFLDSLVELDREALSNKVGLLAGLEDLFLKKDGSFREQPEYPFYMTKLENVLSTYNNIGIVEGFKTAIPKYADSMTSLMSIAVLYNKKFYPEALAKAAIVQEEFPDYLPLQFKISSILEKLGKNDEALSLLEIIEHHHPADLYAKIRIAELKQSQGRSEDAINICRKIFNEQTTPPLWRRVFITFAVKAMLSSSKIDDAFKEALEIRDKYSSDPYMQYNIASLFHSEGIRETSEDLFSSLLSYLDGREDCLEFRRLRSGIHFHLGSMHLERNRKKEALFNFSWSLRYNLAHERAAEMVRSLRTELSMD